MLKLDITSITISELSLILLFVFIIFYAHDSISRPKDPQDEIEKFRQEISKLNNEISSLNKKVSQLNNENKLVNKEVARLNTEIDTLKSKNQEQQEKLNECQGKRSRQLPSCREKGVTDDWLAEIEIVGNKYRILKDNIGTQGIDFQKLYSIDDIYNFYEDHVNKFRDIHQCQESILIKADESLNVKAQNRLRTLFYETTVPK